MNKQRKAIIEANEISEIRTYNLGGYEQKVLIEGRKKENPIVIFLHGGPGSPVPFSVGCRGMFPEITEKATMVYWDQLGSGINDRVIDESFTIDRFVKMTVDLIEAIKKDFPENELRLFAVSWGSILSARAAAEVPELLDGVVVYGQVLKNLSFNDEIFEVLEKSKMPEKLKKRLREIKTNETHTVDDMRPMAGWVRKYTDGYQCKEGQKAPLGNILWQIYTSPDYKFKDFKAIVMNGTMKNKSLLNELLTVDTSDLLAGVKIPYVVIQGETDIVTSTKAVKAFIEESDNPNLKFKAVEKSGHIPGPAAMDEIISTVMELQNKN